MIYFGIKISEAIAECEKNIQMLDMAGDCSSGTTTGPTSTGPMLTLEKLQEVMKEFRGPIIKVWRGEPDMCLLQNQALEPRFQPSSHILDKEKMYILAGTGVIGHPDIIERLKAADVRLEWSNDPVEYLN